VLQDSKRLSGKVALVAGATRGAGRAIAVELARAGATVYATGRSSRVAGPSEVGRPETIEETGGRYGHFGTTIWEHGLPDGLRMLRIGIDTHAITSHFALPLVIRHPGGLVVEMTNGTAEYNAAYRHREGFYYDLVKAAVQRMTIAQAYELGPHRASAVAVTPGWMRSEDMLDFYGVSEQRWREAAANVPHFCISESPTYTGRAVAALAADPEVARWNGQVVSTGQLAPIYGFTDTDGTQPDCWRYVVEV
jgi:NAD(P)-dependent dehydrogenase (short-subunit alcohol dehydrogenase family)